MTIYNINFGIGWASSGVEYAQAYRANLLRKSRHTQRYVFLDFIQSENIQTLTSNIGFQDDEIIWIYQYFTDIKIAPTTYTIDDIRNDINEPVTRVEHIGKIKRLYLNNNETFITCYLKEENENIVNRAEFVVNNMLIRKDFYSYVRVFSEYYAPAENKAKLYMRQFYNEDGSIVYNEYVDGDSSMYSFQNAKLYSKAEFVAYFIKQLQLTSEDIIILDRATGIGQAVLQNKGHSRVGVIVHAEHYSDNMTNNSQILWNNYYEYQFSNAKEIDFFVTATDIQNKTLKNHFDYYYDYTPKIYTIPVGSLDKLKYPQEKRKAYSMISASRLANEKHIDWLVRATIKAKQRVPELTLDIYGEGNEKSRINDIINEHNAQDYIQLLGHVNLEEKYKNYKLFVSASTSEGFGLTLMEAVGSGLGLLGFDVNYGNPTFINDNHNGYLIPLSLQNDDLENIIDSYSKYIIKFFNDGPKDPHKYSYEIAESFMTQSILTKWEKLIDEVLYD
nr:accessory Sec system glycosyltransferase GtfA [Mammaliicoccus sp. Marseille-Q6498]